MLLRITKILLPSLIIFLIILFSIPPVHAEGAVSRGFGSTDNTGPPADLACEAWNSNTWFRGCMLRGLVGLLDLGLQAGSWFVAASSGILDIILKVQNESFYDQPMVNIGWTISRDVVNIFYILFLLIIAIATILGISSYGMKQLLWKLILSALLVNFSLPLGGLVIDFSNALGNSFYSHMGTVTNGERSLATTMVKGLQPGNIYAPGKAAALFQKGAWETFLNIIIAFFMGIFLEIVATFVILAAAFLLVIRIVILWLVLILSPFAFLFLVLPRTSSISNKWFETLFNQSFFYPAYMFMLYIVFKAIDGGVIDKLFMQPNTPKNIENLLGAEGLGSMSKLSSSPALILSFVTLGILLVSSLIVAKSMGAYGASAAMAYGQKTARSARSYAGGAASRAGWRTLDWADKKTGSVASTGLGRIPLVSRGITTAIQKADAARKYQSSNELKKIQNLDPRAQARALATISAKGQKAWFDKADEKRRADVANHIGNMSPGFADKISSNIYNAAKKDGDDPSKIASAVAFKAGTSTLHDAMRMHYDDMNDESMANDMRNSNPEEYNRRVDDLMKLMAPEQKNNIYNKELETNENVQDYFVKNESGLGYFTKNREQIMKGNRFVAKMYERFDAHDAPEMAQKMKAKYGDKNKVGNLIASSIGVNLLLAPHSVPITAKKDDKLEKMLKEALNKGGGGTHSATPPTP